MGSAPLSACRLVKEDSSEDWRTVYCGGGGSSASAAGSGAGGGGGEIFPIGALLGRIMITPPPGVVVETAVSGFAGRTISKPSGVVTVVAGSSAAAGSTGGDPRVKSATTSPW